MKSICLLTGAPGSGKTTLLREVISAFPGKVGGFYTQELRTQGLRQGFQLVTLSGQEVVLAHVSLPGPPRVAKYGVDVASLERVGVAALHLAIQQDDLIVVDEIGKMELFSSAFREVVTEALGCGKPVLGTIMLAPHPWADRVKLQPQVHVLELTRENREQICLEVQSWLAGA